MCACTLGCTCSADIKHNWNFFIMHMGRGPVVFEHSATELKLIWIGRQRLYNISCQYCYPNIFCLNKENITKNQSIVCLLFVV